MTNLRCSHRDPDGSWSTWEFDECPRCQIARLTAERDQWKLGSVTVNERLLDEIERLKDALAWIASREPEARRAVDAGHHNTTFAIDLASAARLAMEGLWRQPWGGWAPESPTADEPTPVHPDPTGKTREPPHCPTCDCQTDSAAVKS